MQTQTTAPRDQGQEIKMDNDITVIFDNGGGITLQVVNVTGQDYQHAYDTSQIEQCANDIHAALSGQNPSADWEGNDLDDDDINLLDPSEQQIENGGYRVVTVNCAEDLKCLADSGWDNAEQLAEFFA
jgi:hypothetical protein